MANLRANKITSTEVFDTTGSVQFDGSTGYLTVPRSSDLDLGTGQFTVEAWVYVASLSSSYRIVGLGEGANGSPAYYTGWNFLILSTDSSLRWYKYDGTTETSLGAAIPSLSLNQWNHFAVTRDSTNTIRLFVNGVVNSTHTGATTSYDGVNSDSLYLGRQYDGTGGPSYKYSRGFTSNVRILKGTALYTSNFTPPFRELEVIPNTVLLCAQSKTRANEERTGKTITVNGNAVASELTPGLLTNTVRSGGSSAITGSVDFNGSNSYLTIPDNIDFTLGSNNFTLECWVYFKSTNPSLQIFLGQNNGNASGASIDLRYSSSSITAYAFYGNSSVFVSGAASLNTWHHVAWVRDGSTMRLFINGSQVGTDNISTNTINDSSVNFEVGSVSGGNYLLNGFLSNVRLIKGQALYTQNFIPPARRLTRLPGTVLLCCTDSKSATAEATGKTITVNGNATASNQIPQVGSDGGVVFDGATKINTQNYFYLAAGPTEQRSRGRGIMAGGNTGSATNKIDYISISTLGNAITFGALNNSVSGPGGGVSSSTRGLVAGGVTSGAVNINNIDFITLATTGNATSFGILSATVKFIYGGSNNTRGIFGGGETPGATNLIQYVTISTTGNAASFGNLTAARGETGSCSSSIRCLWGSGYLVPLSSSIIDYVTIASTGNAVSFGNLTSARTSIAASSSPTRGIFGGQYSPISNVIDYVTISSTGNASSFGNLSAPRFGLAATSNSIRGVFCGGQQPTFVNTMEYVTIASTGNVSKFGDLTSVTATPVGCSDSHGGLG